MRCEKCEGDRFLPKDISKDLDKYPFGSDLIFDIEKAKKIVSFSDFLQYIVSIYGVEIYREVNKLYNHIDDLYVCEERKKRMYRRAILEDMLSLHIYELYHTELNERKFLYNQIVSQFLKKNIYPINIGKQIVDDFICGLQLKITNPTVATEGEGKWIDNYGVIYSANREKLIKGNSSLKKYRVRKGTLIICDEAFNGCFHLSNIKLPKTLKIIGSNVFDHTKLSHVYLPNSLKYLDGNNFSDFDFIKYIGIPRGSSNKFKSLINPQYHFKIKEGSLFPILLQDKINQSEAVGCWVAFILYMIYLTITFVLYYHGYLDARGLAFTALVTSIILGLVSDADFGSFIAIILGFTFFSMTGWMLFDSIFFFIKNE